MADVKVKKLTRLSEFAELMELQKNIWILEDYGDCLPEHVMIALKDIGGLILGAFDGFSIVGFMIAIPAYSADRGFYQRSHILGIKKEYRSQNIAWDIKKAHYEYALEMGVSRIDWTYDPLLGPNARLNIAKLGGVVRTYKLNEYGENMGGSQLVSGIPSDRFLCEWFINTPRVRERMEKARYDTSGRHGLPDDLKPVNVVENKNGLQVITGFRTDFSSDTLLFEIPGNYQMIFDKDKALAKDWRLKSREFFNGSLSSGYMVTDFLRKGDRNIYVLQKDFSI